MTKIRFRYEKQSDGVQISFYLYRGHALVARIWFSRWNPSMFVITEKERITLDRLPGESRPQQLKRAKDTARALFADPEAP
jgi:hypothetical protein